MKKLILALGLIPVIAIGAPSEEMQAEMNKQLTKSGLPIPGSGLQVVPNGQIKMTSWQRDKFKADAAEMRVKGYIDETSERAYELMHFDNQVKQRGYSPNPSTNEGDSGLHHSADEIAFSYSYVGVPHAEISEFYGIAPAGAFLQEPQKGWTGAVAFFKTNLSHCAYTEKNMAPGQGAVQVEDNVARSDVNGKLTTVEVMGNENSGFLYNIFWFDVNFYRQLECATASYSTDTLNKTIELAKKIDIN